MASGKELPRVKCLQQAIGGMYKVPELVKVKHLCVWDRAKACSRCANRNCSRDCWPIPPELEKLATTLVALVGVADGEYVSEVRERALAKVLDTERSFRGRYATYSRHNKAMKLKGSHGDQRETIGNNGGEETGDYEEDEEEKPEDHWKRVKKQQETILSEQTAFIKQANETFDLFKNAITTLEDSIGSLREEFRRDIEAVGKKIDDSEEKKNIREENLLEIA